MNLNLWSKQLSAYFPCLLFEVISTAADLYMYSYRYIYIFYYLGEWFRNVSASVCVSSDCMEYSWAWLQWVSHCKGVHCPDQLTEPVEGESEGFEVCFCKIRFIIPWFQNFSIANIYVQYTGKVAYKAKYQFKC